MNPLTNCKNIYFIGIGGIGMSALARYFNTQGVVVSGYDKTPTLLTDALVEEGIQIHFEDDLAKIDKEATVIVYTPAIPNEHGELNYYRDNKYLVVKRSDVLQWITENAFTIAIAGTHGKTTTTSMTAHILRHTGYGCNAFLGGIATNYGTNFWSHEKNVVVVEADEYDRSFLKLAPNIAVITAVDPDHLDIYGKREDLIESFNLFAEKTNANGFLITKAGIDMDAKWIEKSKKYHTKLPAQIQLQNCKLEGDIYHFSINIEGHIIENLQDRKSVV
jgi:UDP-N-acetylmuramate--alanine ligase